MRLAIISDIHGNWEALTAVMEAMVQFKPEQIICLGDVVGYGADPQACLELVKDQCAPIIRGNHEAALLNQQEKEHMNPIAEAAIEWTARQLPPSLWQEFNHWPLIQTYAGLCLVHASPCRPEDFYYLTNWHEIKNAYSAFSETICFYGHTHQPLVLAQDNISRKWQKLPAGVVKLEANKKYLINVGSVGQPRDGDQQARWVTLNDEQVAFHRVAYDIPKAQKKILEAGLPKILADRLLWGK